MTLISEDYTSVFDKIRDNSTFVIWYAIFMNFTLVGGLFILLFANRIWGYGLILLALVFLIFILSKLRSVKVKIRVTDDGIFTDRLFIMGKYYTSKKLRDIGTLILFYDLKGFRVSGKTIKIFNKTSDIYDDMNLTFSNLSDENLEAFKNKLLERRVEEI